MRKPDLFFEEAILDDMSQSLDSLEIPVSKGVFRGVGIFVLIICLIVFGRILYLNILEGDFYKNSFGKYK
jgi:hypothetical protein